MRKIGIGVALAAAGALAIVSTTAGADDAGSSVTRTIKCTVLLAKQQDPGPTQKGIDFARITCSKPFGRGAQYDTFGPIDPSDPTKLRMDWQGYFEEGSIRGTWDVTAVPDDTPCGVHFVITRVTVTRGTGDFRRARARTGSGRAAFTDPENAPACSHATARWSARISGLPR